jgi:hypothetical protein
MVNGMRKVIGGQLRRQPPECIISMEARMSRQGSGESGVRRERIRAAVRGIGREVVKAAWQVLNDFLDALLEALIVYMLPMILLVVCFIAQLNPKYPNVFVLREWRLFVELYCIWVFLRALSKMLHKYMSTRFFEDETTESKPTVPPHSHDPQDAQERQGQRDNDEGRPVVAVQPGSSKE